MELKLISLIWPNPNYIEFIIFLVNLIRLITNYDIYRLTTYHDIFPVLIYSWKKNCCITFLKVHNSNINTRIICQKKKKKFSQQSFSLTLQYLEKINTEKTVKNFLPTYFVPLNT